MNKKDYHENDSQSEPLNENTLHEESNDTERTSWKKVVMGGVSGIALGAAGMLFSGAKLPDPKPEPTPEPDPEPELSPLAPGIEDPDAISIATGVNDKMTFSEAFAAARHEVGANGAFMWHGQVYTTCYAEEWYALSPEEQNVFSQHALAAMGVHQPQTPSVTPAVDNPAVPGNHDSGGVSINVNVLGVEENLVTEDGDVINIGVAEVEGHDAVFVDADADGKFDILAVDGNDDGYIEDNEIMEINNPNLNVEAFNNAAQNPSDSDELFAQIPDIENTGEI